MATRNESISFERGYVCAVATTLRQHGDTVIAADALRTLGLISWINVDAYDRQIFKDAGLKLSDF